MSQETAGRWLLIVDNADDHNMLYTRVEESDESVSSPALLDYLPFSRKGSILFTTRNHEAAVKQAETNVVTIEDMTESESLELLKTSLIIEKGKAVIESDAKNLVRRLEYLPLAIKQAAAFINQKRITISDYVEICESSDNAFIELLSKEFEDQGRYKTVKNPIASTWWISFRQIYKDNRIAAKYLNIMSCLAQRAIPRSILPQSSKLNELQAIGTLKGYAFITELQQGSSYDIHRLVQIAVRTWLKEEGKLQQWSGEALKQVSTIFPRFEHGKKNECIAYLPHAQYILDFQDIPGDFQESLRILLSKVGVFSYYTGNYIEAKNSFQQALEVTKQAFGDGHPDTLTIMNNLAFLYTCQGKYAEAETLQQQTLELRKQVLGDGHPNTLDSMNNLAILYKQQGKYAEGETLQQQTLELKKQILGDNHPSTLTSMNNLAILYTYQGKYAEAEMLQQQTIELKKQVLGNNHPDTLTSINNLVIIIRQQGKHAEAERLRKQALE